MSKNDDISSLLVLGLVAERPRHAYEVEACIRERKLRQWTAIGFSSLYALLDRLEREGLLQSTRETVGKRPARRTYSITDEGLARVRKGVTALLETPTEHRSPICVALALSAGTPPQELVAPLERLSANADAALVLLEQREQAARAQWWSPVLAATFAHDRALIEAEAKWARETARALADAASQPSAWQEWAS